MTSAPAQLTLLDDVADRLQPDTGAGGWRLDRATRARGLRGVDAARRALEEARARLEARAAA